MDTDNITPLPEMSHIIETVDLSARAGKILLESGADIMRVEDTINHMMRSYGITQYDIYTLTNGIFVSAFGYRSATMCNGINIPAGLKHGYLRIHNIPRYSTNLGKVDAVNTLSRNIEKGGISIEQAHARLDEIEIMKPPSVILRLIAAAFASGTICFMFGGSWSDSLISALIGFSYYIVAIILDKTKLSKLITNAICGLIIAALTVLSVILGLTQDMNIVIVGAIMPLIPGVAFTNAVRDIAYGDYISGSVRLIDTAVISFGIAAGVGSGIAVFRFFGLI